jgi:hypothetical protein
LHFTPTSSSGLNLVECWFSELTSACGHGRGALSVVVAAQRAGYGRDRRSGSIALPNYTLWRLIDAIRRP